MKSLSQYKGEEALDLLADIMEPLAKMLADKDLVKKFRANKIAGIGYAIKKHKKDVLTVMARLEDKPVKQFKEECNLLTLPKQILEILNDKDLMGFFTSQQPESKVDSAPSSGDATEDTQEENQYTISLDTSKQK